MKTNILIGLCLLIIASCQTKIDNKIDPGPGSQEIEGELFFKLINMGRFENLPDSTISKFESMSDSLHGNKNISEQDQKVLRSIKLLKENNLIHKAYFHLKIDSTQIVTVYVNEEEYKKLRPLDRQKLMNENMKRSFSAPVISLAFI